MQYLRSTFSVNNQSMPNELLERTALKFTIFAFAKIRALKVSRSTRC